MNVANPEHKGLEDRVSAVVKFMSDNYYAAEKKRLRIGTGTTEIPECTEDMPPENGRGIAVLRPYVDGISLAIYPTIFGDVDTSAASWNTTFRPLTPKEKRFKANYDTASYTATSRSIAMDKLKRVLEMHFPASTPSARVAHFYYGTTAEPVSVTVGSDESRVLVVPYKGILKMAYEISDRLSDKVEWGIVIHGKKNNFDSPDSAWQFRRHLYGNIHRKSLWGGSS